MSLCFEAHCENTKCWFWAQFRVNPQFRGCRKFLWNKVCPVRVFWVTAFRWLLLALLLSQRFPQAVVSKRMALVSIVDATHSSRGSRWHACLSCALVEWKLRLLSDSTLVHLSCALWVPDTRRSLLKKGHTISEVGGWVLAGQSWQVYSQHSQSIAPVRCLCRANFAPVPPVFGKGLGVNIQNTVLDSAVKCCDACFFMLDF